MPNSNSKSAGSLGKSIISLSIASTMMVMIPQFGYALNFSSDSDGTMSVGSCTLDYATRTGGQANIRKGLGDFFTGGGFVSIAGGYYQTPLTPLNVESECGPFEGFLTEAPALSLFDPVGPVTEFGFSYCVGENLYRHGFYGATGTVILNGDQGVSPECSRPKIAVSMSETSLASGETATVTFTLTQDTDDFDASDVAVTGGALSGFSGSGASYSATFTPTAGTTGTGSVSVASGVLTNTAVRNLPNTDGADANNSASVSIDTQPPADPTLNVAVNADGSVTASGTTDAGASVTVTFPDGTTKTVIADGNGDYSATSDARQTNGTVSAIAEDDAGNQTNLVTTTYTDTTAPDVPTVSGSQNADGTVTASGTAEPGSTVTVTFPDGSTDTAVADGAGNYSVTSATPQTSGTITANAEDAAGNTSGDGTDAYVDSMAPQSPVVNAVQNADGTVTASGTAEPGSTVEVTFPDGSTGSAVANASGNYSVTSASAQDSGTVSANATDAAGNTSPDSTTTVTDTFAPAAPAITSVTQNPDGTVTVTGTTEPGAQVEVSLPDGTTETVIADGTGAYSLTSSESQPSGDVSVTSTDTAGNTSAATTEAFTDTVAAPFEVTDVTSNNDGTVRVSGTAEPGATISVTFPDGSTGTTTAGPDGSYTLDSASAQPSGDVTATMTDVANNSSAPITTPFTDTTAPTAPFFDTVEQNGDGTVTVAGTAEPGSTVTVTFPDGTSKDVVVPASGKFTATSDASQPTGTVTAVATDDAGNTSGEVSQTITDGVAPPAPFLLEVTQQPDGTVLVSGEAEPGSTVDITFPDGTTAQLTAGPDGSFSTTSATSMPSGTVTATSTDSAGNTSGETTRTFTDTVAPAVPTIADVAQNNDSTATVSGTADPGSSVTVTFPDGTSTTVTAGPDGSFSATSSTPQSSSGTIHASASDDAGNSSLDATAPFTDGIAPHAPLFDTVTRNEDGSLVATGTAEPGSVVKVTFPDGSNATVIADANGAFTVTSGPNQPSGTVVATATDSAGNQSGETAQAVAAGGDTSPPVIQEVTQNEDGTLTVSGTATPGDTVTVTFPDGSTGTAVADAGGSFRVTSQVSQPDGNVTATATDPSGTVSAQTTSSFTDEEAPVIATPTIEPNTDGTITVSGTTGESSQVTVTFPDDSQTSVASDGSGAYTTTSTAPQESGDVTVEATDDAGNRSDPVTVSYVKDTTAPTVTATASVTGSTATVTLTFSEPVSGLTADDFAVNGLTGVTLTGGPEVFTLTATLPATGTATVSLPQGAATDATGNPNQAMAPLALSTAASVGETQKVIASFMMDRANNLLSHQPDLIPFLRDRASGHFTADVTSGNGTLSYASRKDKRVWAELDSSWSTEGQNESKYVFGVVGSHFVLHDNLLVGGMLQFDHQSQVTGAQAVEGTGWMAGPYFVAKHQEQELYYEGRLLYGRTENEVTPTGGYTDDFSTERWLAQFRMAGEYKTKDVTYFPFLDARYTKDTQKAYTDSNGQLITGQSVNLGQMQVGFDFERDLGNDLTWTGGVTGIWSKSGGTAASVSNVEGGRGSIETGLTYRPSANTTLRGTLRYDGIGLDDYERVGVNLEFSTRF